MKERMEVPQLSLEERDRRWKEIRKAMAERNLDCLIVTGVSNLWGSGSANVRYICNFGEDSYCVFPKEGEPTYFIWTRCMLEWAKKLLWVEDVRFGQPFWSYAIAERIKELGVEKSNIGVVGLSDFPPIGEGTTQYQTYVSLQKKLPHANFQDATGLIEKIRMIKSPAELKFIEKAAELGDRAIEVMARDAKKGVRESEVYANMIHEILIHGGEYPPIILMSSGPVVRQAGYFPQQRILKEGDVILTELYPRYGGYFAHPQQPIFIGKVDKTYEECLELSLKSIEEGLKALVPGKTLQEVDEAFSKPILDAGCYYDAPCVHSTGLSGPEIPLTRVEAGVELQKTNPGWSFYLHPEFSNMEIPNFVIQPGMVFALEPSACKGEKGVHVGPTVVIEKDGPRIISKYGRDVIRV